MAEFRVNRFVAKEALGNGWQSDGATPWPERIAKEAEKIRQKRDDLAVEVATASYPELADLEDQLRAIKKSPFLVDQDELIRRVVDGQIPHYDRGEPKTIGEGLARIPAVLFAIPAAAATGPGIIAGLIGEFMKFVSPAGSSVSETGQEVSEWGEYAANKPVGWLAKASISVGSDQRPDEVIGQEDAIQAAALLARTMTDDELSAKISRLPAKYQDIILGTVTSVRRVLDGN